MPKKPKTFRPANTQRQNVERRRQQDSDRNQDPHRKLYSLRRYRKFRMTLLRERPVCEDCDREPGFEVHHSRGLAKHPEDLCDSSHCIVLCKVCHSRRTGRGE